MVEPAPRADRHRALTPDLDGWAARTLGHDFADPSLLRRAMTHPSAGQPNYQRLEFLGDRILGCVIAAWLYDDLDEAEGKLSARLHQLVDSGTCAQVAHAMGVPERLILDRATRAAHVAQSTNVLGDVTEALIAAIYLDAGWPAAEAFVRRAWAPLIDTGSAAPENPKSRLQEIAAAKRLGAPVYAVVWKDGPDHRPNFRVSVTVRGHPPTEGVGTSKQEAEKAAAAQMLEKLA
ncbi:ribonuclease III [Glacieibacterium frigidum]|uniref:Ribonuclease 3 n=1 Tax=Glacieibacterium frigidum TaxID=2593303 RepID=A0A552UIU2_9SPHN|nr:ribonuclease III [Glacieibacterium frigidum]